MPCLRPFIALVVLALAQGALAAPPKKDKRPGTLVVSLTADSKSLQPKDVVVQVLDLSDELRLIGHLARNAISQDVKELGTSASFRPMKESVVTPASHTSAGWTRTYRLTKGKYRLRVLWKDSSSSTTAWAWSEEVEIKAGKTTRATIRVPKVGVLTASWSLARSIKGSLSVSAVLVRDGLPWANVSDTKPQTAFELRAPEGTYSLVLRDFFGNFHWVRDKVRIEPDGKNHVELSVDPSKLGGVFVLLAKGRKPFAARLNKGRMFLFDADRRVVLTSNLSGTHILPNRLTVRGFQHVPRSLKYTALVDWDGYRLVRKAKVKVGPNTSKERGNVVGQVRPVYPVVKVKLKRGKRR